MLLHLQVRPDQRLLQPDWIVNVTDQPSVAVLAAPLEQDWRPLVFDGRGRAETGVAVGEDAAEGSPQLPAGSDAARDPAGEGSCSRWAACRIISQECLKIFKRNMKTSGF